MDNSTVLNVKTNNSGHGFDVMQFETSLTNPTKIRAFESKPMTDGRIKLPQTNTGVQMSNRWRRAKIDEMINSPDPNVENLGKILDANYDIIEPYVLTVDKNLKQVIIKLSNF